MSRFVIWALPIAVLTVACSDEERVAPVGEGGAGATSVASGPTTSSGGGSTSTSTGSGPVLRTVFERNPFGDQVGNLLADGDFELSFGRPGQQGWIGFAATGQIGLVAETGGLCRSGLRCARVGTGGGLFARGTSAADQQPMRAEIWAKPMSTPSCEGISASVISCDSFATKALLSGPPATDADGWCVLQADVPRSKVATCIYLENGSDQEMLLDDARLVVADDSTSPAPAPIVTSELAELRARKERLRKHLRDTLPLGPPPLLPPGTKPLPGRAYAEPLDMGP